ncbi:hypothetical protein FRC12_023364 [Ceratobasidium sp. 428]|nr:hypothetical protein FRC12_023364 [Ceratobasidium sp. 428]
MKVKEGEAKEEIQAEDTPTEPSGLSGKSHRQLSIGMAEYIATGAAGGCLTAVIDCIFKNPEHKSCYETGGCKSCARRRQEQEVDQHQEERQEN